MLKSNFIFTAIIAYSVCVFFLSCTAKQEQVELINLPDYPSGSGIEYYQNHFYLVGDDANHLLQLDKNFKITDSIQLYNSSEKRIPKNIKADLEAVTVLDIKETSQLLLIGSGSLFPHRNTGWLINPSNGEKDSIRLDSFYQALKNNGLAEINIEGACTIPGAMILSNRGHKAWPENYLVIANPEFWKDTSTGGLNLIRLIDNKDSTGFRGVSGLAYAPETDWLVLTVSTEDTKSSYEDGTIGKSYLWFIKNFSTKIKSINIRPDRVLELETIDKRFAGQKIESACIVDETNDYINIVLVADNDAGSSVVFRLRLRKSMLDDR